MTVYIDDMFSHPMGRLGRMKMSHMIANTDKELMRMAEAIGVPHRHVQRDHFDVCEEMRAKAIKLGAVEVTMKQLGAMVLLRRAGRRMGEPEHAIGRWHAWNEEGRKRLPRRKRA